MVKCIHAVKNLGDTRVCDCGEVIFPRLWCPARPRYPEVAFLTDRTFFSSGNVCMLFCNMVSLFFHLTLNAGQRPALGKVGRGPCDEMTASENPGCLAQPLSSSPAPQALTPPAGKGDFPKPEYFPPPWRLLGPGGSVDRAPSV